MRDEARRAGKAADQPHSTPRSAARLPKRCLAALALLSALSGGFVQAATFGHARLASPVGEPLRILVPVSDLTAADLEALTARPAPAADWARAGLNPPVALDSLRIVVTQGVRRDAGRVLEIRSAQPFTGTLADLLLDVRTATGEQRYQVSLIAPEPPARRAAPVAVEPAPAAAPPAGSVGAPATHASIRLFPAGSIQVRPGDTMFSIARRHAVDGVSVYQLMLALQRANPQAFIRGNINRVRAGATLAVPAVADMVSISDAEARRRFMAQVAALGRRGGARAGPAASAPGRAAGSVSAQGQAEAAGSTGHEGDQLRLTEPGSATADARAAQGHALQDARSRVDQLQDNVQNLNQALQSQGEAARSAMADGAQAIGNSIQNIASAISEASHDAASRTGNGPSGTAGAPDSHPGTAPVAGGAGQTARGAAGIDAGGIPAARTDSVAEASAHAEAAEQKATERTRGRVSWLQDHLLGVMTGLLAIIVFIIAWLLRRANAARDEAEIEPRISEAMVREKLQGIDLDLTPGETRPTAPNA